MALKRNRPPAAPAGWERHEPIARTTEPLPKGWVNEHDAAEILGLTSNTMRTHRTQGSGPVFYKRDTGRERIAYRIADLEEYRARVGKK